MELVDFYSSGGPPDYENPISVPHSEKKGTQAQITYILKTYPLIAAHFCPKVTKESDSCDASEESGIFTGQRLNKKMQVYSGAKTTFLPSMMSLHQQCIRTLQNNINCE